MLPLSRKLLAVAAVALLTSAGSLYGQGATLAPTPHDFGSIVVGQSSSPVSFIFTNNSSSSEMVNSVVPSNPVEFPGQPGSTCPGIVPAHMGCTISIVFTPTTTGPASGQVEVDSNDATNPQLFLNITGTGVASTTTSTLTPGSAAFGSVNVGSNSSASTFTLTNTGNTTIGNIQIGVTGDYSATPNCTATLAPAANCTINVSFNPTAPGARNGTLTVNSTSSSGPLTASLTGTGLSNGLTLSTYALSLGSYEVGAAFGSSASMQVQVTNNDSTAITFGAPPFGGTGINFPLTGDFLDNNDCTQILPPGGICKINVFFHPSTTGTRVGSLTVQSTASNGTQTLTLSGNGTDVTLAAASSTVTVVQGQTAVYAITYTPISGFSDTLTLSCSGLTALGTTCGGDDVTLGPTTTSNFNVNTSPKNLYGITASGYAPQGRKQTRTAGVIGLCSLLLLALAGRTRRLARAAGLLALLLAMLWPTGGCSGKQPTPNPNATAPGTYNFTLATVDNAKQHKSLSLTLIVTAEQ